MSTTNSHKRSGSAVRGSTTTTIRNGRRKITATETTKSSSSSSSYLDHTVASTSLVRSNLQNAAREARNLENSRIMLMLESSSLSISAAASSSSRSESEHVPSHFLSSSSYSASTASARAASFHQSSSAALVNNSSLVAVMLQNILQDIAEIKKKFPITNVSDSTVKEIWAGLTSAREGEKEDLPQQQEQQQEQQTSPMTAIPPLLLFERRNGRRQSNNTTTLTSTTISSPLDSLTTMMTSGDPSNNTNHHYQSSSSSSTISNSQQLALERELHRQKLDQVWRCAQGWKSRCRELESQYKKFAQSILVQTELKSLIQSEDQFRLEVMKNEANEFSSEILLKFKTILLSTMVNSPSAYALPSWNSIIPQNSNSNSLMMNSSGQIVYRVKDSELLRALKVAEERLAELGEPTIKMLSLKKNLVTY